MTCLTVLKRDVSKVSGPTKTFNDTFKLHEESPYDQIRRKWAQHCISLLSHLFTASSSSEDMENEVVIGWVLAKTRRSDRFSEQVRSILVEQFMIGEETGRKVTSVKAATRMRSLRDETGNRKFGKGAWLTPQQITSYFSRLAAMKKKKNRPSTSSYSMSWRRRY